MNGAAARVFRRMILASACLAVFASWAVEAEVNRTELERVDALHYEERHEEILERLERLSGEALSSREVAEIRWREARAVFSRADLAWYAGEMTEGQAMEEFERTVDLATEAIELDDRLARAYLWRAAGRGSLGRLRGVLDSLFMADDIRDDLRQAAGREPEYANTYYAAGELYHLVPGWPISFGDIAMAVSFGRKAVDLHEDQLDAGEVPARFWDFQVKLADHLLARSWSESRRADHREELSQQYREAEDPFEQGSVYEGRAELPDQSDAQEAAELLRFVISGLEAQDTLTVRQQRTLEDARDLQ